MQRFQHGKTAIHQLAFAPDSRTLAAIGLHSNDVVFCDMADGTYRTWPRPGSTSWIESIAYSPAGDVFGVGDHSGFAVLFKLPEHIAINVYQADTLGEGQDELDAFDAGFNGPNQTPVHAIVFAPHRVKAPVAGVASAGIVLYSARRKSLPLAMGIELGTREIAYSHLAWSPKGDMIAAFDEEYKQVTLWRLDRSLHPSKAIVQYALPSACTGLAFSPDNQWLALAHENAVYLENVRRRHVGPYEVLDGHDDAVTAVAFHPGGGIIATAGRDETVRFWNFATRRQTDCFRWKIGAIHALAFSPDGFRCAVGGDEGRVVVWDVG